MKKICALIMCMPACGAALFAQTGVASAADFDTEADGAPNGGGVVITWYKGTGGNVVIPAAIGRKAVVGIGDKAFSDNESLASVTLPEGLTTIGEGAFYYCDGLKAIRVAPANKQYKDIDGVLFTKDGKTLVAYPGGGKTAYTIPAGVTSIGERAFRSCTSLTSVTIPNSVTTIGERAFRGCESLTSVTIPAGVTSIGLGAFEWCRRLTSVTIPDGVTTIGEWAFCGCSGLTLVTIPAGVTSIGEGAFYGCTSLTSVVIPDSVTTIGEWAFYDCAKLTSVTIPADVTSIARGAFRDCTSLMPEVRADIEKRFGKDPFASPY